MIQHLAHRGGMKYINGLIHEETHEDVRLAAECRCQSVAQLNDGERWLIGALSEFRILAAKSQEKKRR
ncbi:hypothetical protein PanWU01x14_339560 [Parasponia andersonii]|uniref:Uncharacterized protein n=1 Tax=Parasponia andersonii TaxID=3476 RepID=A0A2P5AER8_PARAD|nr:hypothetical protein PanWU01x14_339560 [Parasponia andersonii]